MILLVYLGFFGAIPSEADLLKVRNATASIILDRNENQVGRIFQQNRTEASFEEFPENLVQALIATEDARFFEHEGIDPRSLLRVVVKSLILGDRSAGGGSTLSQQLAKNLFGRGKEGAIQLAAYKIKEMLVATRLEDAYSKEELLELYFNTVPFSENIYGIETAAKRFFNCEVTELTPEKSAVLVGMLKANTYYNPRRNPEHALERRNLVLMQMHRYSYLSEPERDSLSRLPLELNYYNPSAEGLAGYYLVQLKKELQEIMGQTGLDEEYDPQSDGLIITCGIDLQMQKIAEASYKKHLSVMQGQFDKFWTKELALNKHGDLINRELQKTDSYKNALNKGLSDSEIQSMVQTSKPRLLYYENRDSMVEISMQDSVYHYLRLLRAGFIAMDPQSGAIRSWIGGRDIKYMPYDHVTTQRQGASTFKPIVFATALEDGMDQCTYWDNSKRIYPEYDDWIPENHDNKYGGYYNMSGALKNSVNVVTVQALFDLGIERVKKTAKALGIESELPNHPSLALGVGSVSPIEMATAYAAFASGGKLHKGYFIERITNREGQVIYERPRSEASQVISESTAVSMTKMLQKVVEEGTARSLRTRYGVKSVLAGKTGTSQNYSDAWFIAYNSNLVVATWVGGAYPEIHFPSGTYGSSTKMALPLVAAFIKELEHNSSMASYITPAPDLNSSHEDEVDCPDYREKNIMDGIKGLFDRDPGKKVDEEKSSNFWNRLFGRKKK